jgi:hypothetical protein
LAIDVDPLTAVQAVMHIPETEAEESAARQADLDALAKEEAASPARHAE